MSIQKIIATVLAIITLHSAPAAAIDAKLLRDYQITDQVFRIDPSKFQRSILPAAVAGKGCRFFEHANGGGASWQKSVAWKAQSTPTQDIYAEYVSSVGPWWNDRISSVVCTDTAKVKCYAALFRDVNKGGGDMIAWGAQGRINLANYGWDNTVSSFTVYCNLMK